MGQLESPAHHRWPVRAALPLALTLALALAIAVVFRPSLAAGLYQDPQMSVGGMSSSTMNGN